MKRDYYAFFVIRLVHTNADGKNYVCHPLGDGRFYLVALKHATLFNQTEAENFLDQLPQFSIGGYMMVKVKTALVRTAVSEYED